MFEFSELKAGDQVIIHDRMGSDIAKVQKITPTGRIKVKGLYFNQRGYQLGDTTWGASYLELPNQEKVEKIKKEKLIKRVKYEMQNFKGNLTYDDAILIMNILKHYH